MAELLRRTLGEGVALETVLGGGLWPTFIDAHQLENALLNLAVNARDAMPNGGRLTIETANATSTRPTWETCRRSLPRPIRADRDERHRNGMDGATIQRAFEPFFTTKPIGRVRARLEPSLWLYSTVRRSYQNL